MCEAMHGHLAGPAQQGLPGTLLSPSGPSLRGVRPGNDARMTHPLQTGAFPVTGCLIKAAPLPQQDQARRPAGSERGGRASLARRAGGCPGGSGHSDPGGGPRVQEPGGRAVPRFPALSSRLRLWPKPRGSQKTVSSLARRANIHPSIHSFASSFVQPAGPRAGHVAAGHLFAHLQGVGRGFGITSLMTGVLRGACELPRARQHCVSSSFFLKTA